VLRAVIRNWDLLDTKQDCQPLNGGGMEVDGTDSGSCPVAAEFGISGAEPWGL